MALVGTHLLVKQEGETSAHYESWTFDPGPNLIGVTADGVIARRREQEAIERAKAEHHRQCERWQAKLEAYLEYCCKHGANAIGLQQAATQWVLRHPAPKLPALLQPVQQSAYDAAFAT